MEFHSDILVQVVLCYKIFSYMMSNLCFFLDASSKALGMEAVCPTGSFDYTTAHYRLEYKR